MLHPDLADGLGPERFLREIKLTARLQHPHILNVFDSGEAGDLLWYTMPYSAASPCGTGFGEIQLSIDDAIDLARQVALALDYAHREEEEKALDQLEQLLRVPYVLSPAWLRIDPNFTSLRGSPRFQRLASGKE